MKILCIPDVHGTSHWKKAKNVIDKVDKIVFLGDYVDNFKEQYKGASSVLNFKEIIEFKKEYPNKIDLLIGNHDLSYFAFAGADNNVSGHQYHCSHLFNEMFKENFDLLDVVVEYDGWVFSHAGFTKTWVDNLFLRYSYLEEESVINATNKLFHNKMVDCLNFNLYSLDPSGNSELQGPVWVRPESLLKDAYFNKQVVGHTEHLELPVFLKSKENKLIIADIFDHDGYFILDTEEEYEYTTLLEIDRKYKKIYKLLNDGYSRQDNEEAIAYSIFEQINMNLCDARNLVKKIFRNK